MVFLFFLRTWNSWWKGKGLGDTFRFGDRRYAKSRPEKLPRRRRFSSSAVDVMADLKQISLERLQWYMQWNYNGIVYNDEVHAMVTFAVCSVACFLDAGEVSQRSRLEEECRCGFEMAKRCETALFHLHIAQAT